MTASGARPNPQGSFRYGSINVTEVYVLKNKPPVTIDGKRRTTLSGISFVNPATPIRLADEFKLKGVYKLDFPTRPITGPPKMETSVINGTYRGFMEVILQNNDTKVQTYHMSGYAFFVVGYCTSSFLVTINITHYIQQLDLLTSGGLFFLLVHLTAVWIMVSGRRIAGALTISGTELLEVQHR